MKKILAFALVAVMALPLNVCAKTLEFTIDDTSLYVNDGSVEKKTLDTASYIENGRTLVPVRAISESFGADVSWNGEERKVTIKQGNDIVVLTIDSTDAVVNGAIKTLDTPAVIKNDTTMVPLRFVSEALSKSVEYVAPTSQVLITDEEPVMTIDGARVTIDDYRFMFLYYNLSQGRYSPQELIPAITADFIATLSVVNDAKKAGFSLDPTQSSELAKSILSTKDSFYPLSLVAPGVKIFSDMMTASEYCFEKFSYGIGYEELLKEYNENYICAKHILIPTIDLQTGESLSEGNIRAAKATAEAVYKNAKSGADFDELIAKHSKDEGSLYYPDGYVFTYGEMTPEFEKSAFSLDENEISRPVKSPYGYHIIKRMPLPEMSYMYEESITASVMQKKLAEYNEELIEKSTIKRNMTDEEIIENLGITNEKIDALIAEIITSQK